MQIAPILVELSAGELLDKLTILQIKCERVTKPEKLRNIRHELAVLSAARERSLKATPELDALTGQLKEANERLWDIENAIRGCEATRDFGPRFIDLARAVYHTNDRRAALKRQINELAGSLLVEEKEYQPYV